MLAPTLVAERLVLRPFVDDDAPLIADGIFGDPDAVANLPEKPQSPAEQLECAWHYLHTYRDLWDSVARGIGLLPHYSVTRRDYLARRG
jgi:RimJ/RimL family protein N-acetyltransferase